MERWGPKWVKMSTRVFTDIEEKGIKISTLRFIETIENTGAYPLLPQNKNRFSFYFRFKWC